MRSVGVLLVVGTLCVVSAAGAQVASQTTDHASARHTAELAALLGNTNANLDRTHVASSPDGRAERSPSARG